MEKWVLVVHKVLLRAGGGDGGCRNREEVFGLGVSSAGQSFPKESSDSHQQETQGVEQGRGWNDLSGLGFPGSPKLWEGISQRADFRTLHVESSCQCRNQLRASCDCSAPSSLCPAPLLHPLDVHFCKFSLQNKPIIFHHRIFTASVSAKFNWLLISSLEVIDADIICTVVNYGAIKLWLFHCNFLCQLI